jgi:triosephosphate isomerase
VVVAPVSIHLPMALAELKDFPGVKVSAQNTSKTKQGAFTGEIAADQVRVSSFQLRQ